MNAPIDVLDADYDEVCVRAWMKQKTCEPVVFAIGTGTGKRHVNTGLSLGSVAVRTQRSFIFG